MSSHLEEVDEEVDMEFLGSPVLANVLLVIVVLLIAFIANEQTAVARRAR